MEYSLQLLREGNHKAFEELFETYFESLSRYAFSILRDGDEAQDVVQKVFYKLWDQRKELEIRTSVKSYLYRIVHNESLNFIQQRANRAEINREISSYNDDATDNVNEQLMASDLQLAINKALDELPPQCRKVFELSRMEQKSYSEIAQSLAISVNTVENHISKALRQLRVALKDYLIVLLIYIKTFS